MAQAVSAEASKDHKPEPARGRTYDAVSQFAPVGGADGVLSLNRAAGNTAVSHLLQSATAPLQNHAIRTLLPTGISGDVDALESQADRIANQILAASPAPVSEHRTSNLPATSDLPGGASPMPSSVRSFFEPRIGMSLDGMGMHSGLESVRNQGAAAVASGSVIGFAPGRFQPSSGPGRSLIAHELAHVLQGVASHGRGVTMPRSLMSPDRIVNIQVNVATRTIVFRIDDGSKIVGTLYENAQTPVGRHVVTYDKKKGMPVGDKLPNFTGFTLEAKDTKRYEKLQKGISNVPMTVIAPRVKSDEEGTGTGKTGTGVGGGAQKPGGGGTTQQTGGGGTTKGKGAGDQPTGGAGGGGITEEQKKAREFLKKLGDGQTVPGVEIDEQKLGEELAKLTAEEIEELIKFIKEAGPAEALDINSAVELFTSMTEEQREIMRANIALKAEGSTVAKPEQVTVAIQQDASTTQDVQKQAQNLNDSLAKIHEKVTDDQKKDWEPIDLSKLNFFKEMMLLEGLLAGAASRNPEIGEIAKRLTTAISGIRGWILEEIAWLAGEIAVGAILSFLAGAVSAGAGTVVTGARIALLIRRLNKLRQLIQRIEGAYNTFQQIKETFAKIKRASQAFKDFEQKYKELMAKVDAFKTRINIDELGEEIPDNLEEAEEKVAELIAEAIQNDEVFGELLDHFYLPPDLTDEQLVQVLMDIPKGVEAFKEVMDFYPKASSSDVKSVTVLALKGVRAGSYLYPFVGFLADIVGSKLSALVEGGDFGSRLLGLLPKGKRTKGRGKKKNKEALRAASDARKQKRKEAREKRAKERAARKKKDAEEAKKTKDKKQQEKQKDAKWKLLKGEIEALAAKYRPDGVTESELKKDVARIRGRYSEVAGKGSIRDTRNQGKWFVEVHRKGKRGKAEARVLMTIAQRQKDVAGKLRRKLDALEKVERTRAKIQKVAEAFKKDYGIDAIEVLEPKKDRDPFIINGTFGTKKLKIGETDVISDHHTGSKFDPIPIFWYKDKSDYPSSIDLTISGKTKSVKMNDTSTVINHNSRRVQVGVSPINMVDKYDDLLRRAEPRERTMNQYMSALKAHGYDMAAKKESPDHVTDLAMNGPDDFDNLWPLDTDINEIGFGWMRDYQIEYLKDGRINSSNIMSLLGKTFRVMGFDKKPTMPGGKGNNRSPASKGGRRK